MPLEQTLGFIIKNNKILLGMKMRGFGEGWYNGIGGKLEQNETPNQCMKREAKEEARIILNDYKKIGGIYFHFPDKDIKVHIYIISDYSRNPEDTEEMHWSWFDLSEIPYEKMWPADRNFIPLLIKNKKFTGDVYFSENKELIKHEIIEVSSI